MHLDLQDVGFQPYDDTPWPCRSKLFDWFIVVPLGTKVQRYNDTQVHPWAVGQTLFFPLVLVI